jgi:hypothetical protein
MIAGGSFRRRGRLSLLYLVLILLAAEFVPPILRGTECDGLDATGDVCITRPMAAATDSRLPVVHR